MAKRWKKEDLSYLKRYAKVRRLAELAERFKTDLATVQTKLNELGLESVDAGDVPFAAMDPMLTTFEKGLKSFYRKKFDEAQAAFEEVVEKTTQLDLKERARLFIRTCLAQAAPDDKSSYEPYLLAVVHKNDGEFEEALDLCSRGGRQGKDQRFAYLAASVHALNESYEEAAKQLGVALELDPKNLYVARSDSDFDEMRELEEYAELFG